MNKVHISIVTPVYGCEASLIQLYERLKTSLTTITDSFEIIMINDSSPDNAWETIQQLATKDTRIKGINFSRNFGQHQAITAGLDIVKGDWVVVMDCDLQDQPEEITKLYDKAQEGFDIVFGRREERQDSFSKKIGSQLFYALLSYLTGTKQNSLIANFGIYNKKTIDSVLLMKDKIKYFPTMIQWVGFHSTAITIKHSSRHEGESSYSLATLIALSIDIMLSFSEKPLKIFVKLGFTISALSFLLSLFVLIKALTTEYTVQGWASMMISLWFLGGLIIMVLGVVGIYIGKTFNQVKNRPTYIIKDKT